MCDKGLTGMVGAGADELVAVAVVVRVRVAARRAWCLGVSCRGHSGGRKCMAVGGRPALRRVRVTFAAWLPQGVTWRECRERVRTEVGVSEA